MSVGQQKEKEGCCSAQCQREAAGNLCSKKLFHQPVSNPIQSAQHIFKSKSFWSGEIPPLHETDQVQNLIKNMIYGECLGVILFHSQVQ